MAEVKYHYNTRSLKYEQVKLSTKDRIFKALGYVASVALFSIIMIVIGYSYIDSPKEKNLKRELSQMKLQYELLNGKLDELSDVLTELESRDDNIYRVIFEANPIDDAIRQAGMGGVNRYDYLDDYENGQLMGSVSQKVDQVSKKMYVQSRSYDEVMEMAEKKAEMLAAIPAIQPVNNRDLKRMASGYGYRIDPHYKVRKLHQGMDFSAKTGTEIYATGDGVVSKVSKSLRGYGYHIIIDHGYGYETLYGHMSEFNVRNGEKVIRGQIIGYVGNTGKSKGPHVHYEVRKNDRAINPVNFYYNDLTPEQYEEMVNLASQSNQALD
jgi:murein DD-endopeptidase MepM/ murein hydrolase activator NlpD